MSSSKWRKCVFGCESFRSLFGLPREEPTRQKWEEFIFGSARHSGQQLFVCDRHFREDCLANLGPYRNGLSGRLNLQAGAVPTIRRTEEEARNDPETAVKQELRKPEHLQTEEPELKRIKMEEEEEEEDVPLAEQGGARRAPPQQHVLKQENGGVVVLTVTGEGTVTKGKDFCEEAADRQRHLLDGGGKPRDAQNGTGVKSEPQWSCSPDQSHTEAPDVKEEEEPWTSQDEEEAHQTAEEEDDDEEKPHSCSSPTRLHKDRLAGADGAKAADAQTVDSSEGAHKVCGRVSYRSFNTMDDWRLITEVQDRPILYDTLHLFYKDNDTKDRAWGEISQAVGVDVDVCQKRWRILRDQFVKNRRKQSGSAGAAQRDWKYADMMSFLSPHVHPRSSRGNIRFAESQDREAAENTEEAQRDTPSPAPTAPSAPSTPTAHSAPTAPSTPTAPSRPTTPARAAAAAPAAAAVRQGRSRSPRERPNPRQHTGRRRSATASLEERLISALQEPPPTPAVPRGQEDEAYHFALSLVPRMVDLTRDGLDCVKIEFLRVLQRVEGEERTRQVTSDRRTAPPTP
ncbi:hypothetical protein OJAV_G00218710 [Oryzias javanicus]|uniref:THAP-type domain-containing protein n=1 Tax=Oryzias javanicus TaxID=123683 RepID=A0A3S2TXG0_ORYJA|nr:hypothetical protein OJAV_G00218710 [Oryzias javanicus]